MIVIYLYGHVIYNAIKYAQGEYIEMKKRFQKLWVNLYFDKVYSFGWVIFSA